MANVVSRKGKKKKLIRSTRANAQAKYERYRRENRRELNKKRKAAKRLKRMASQENYVQESSETPRCTWVTLKNQAGEMKVLSSETLGVQYSGDYGTFAPFRQGFDYPSLHHMNKGYFTYTDKDGFRSGAG